MLRVKTRALSAEQIIIRCVGGEQIQEDDHNKLMRGGGFHFTAMTGDGHTNGYYVGYIHGDGQGCPKLAFISEGESGNGYPKFSNQG